MASKWELIRNYVNTHEIIIRKDLEKHLLIGGTSDNYLNYLVNSGFVKKIGIGKKQRIQMIPEDLSSSMLEKIAYSEPKRIRYFRRLKLIKLSQL